MIYNLLLCLAFLIFVGLADPTKTIVQNAQATPDLSTLVKILTTPGYEPILNALSSPGTYTVFAPNNNAFAQAGVDPRNVAFVTQILLYHTLGVTVPSTALKPLQFPSTLSNASQFVNLKGSAQVVGVYKNATHVAVNFGIPGQGFQTAHVVVADVVSSNGIVHIIDRVLFFPRDISQTAQEAQLNELQKALQKANLTHTVDTAAGITVFAPTDSAMRAANWESLDIPTLTAVLTYHVVPAVAYSDSLKDGQVVPTLNGKTLKIGVSASGVTVNDANVLLANALVENGAVHVIDKVLIPQ